jgi:hypothetical protein
MKSVLRTVVLGGVLGAGIVSGGALAVAQTAGTSAPPATEVPGTVPGSTEPPVTAPGSTAPPGNGATPPADSDKKGEHRGKAGGRGHHGKVLGRLGDASKELAAELGVTEQQLRDARKAALQAVRDLGKPDRPATRPPSDEDKAKLTEALKARAEVYNRTLAEKLGVTTDRLRDARLAVLGKHLDEAVAAGKLTREQADTLLDRGRDAANGDLEGALGGLGKGFGSGHGPRGGGHGDTSGKAPHAPGTKPGS